MLGLDCGPWCKSGQSGSSAGCRRYWPLTSLAIRGLCISDEEATHAKLTALLTDAVAPAIAEHGGRIVKNTGDGFLAEFPSAVEAVRAAMQFQTRIKELTIDDPEDRRIAFRVGINIGDVIVEPNDIFGDGVNIAARLESIAQPGGICISSAAYDQVRGKVGVEFADLGEQNLKNIALPVRAYALQLPDTLPIVSFLTTPWGFPFRLWPARGVRRIRIGLTIAFLLLITGGGVGYWYIRWGDPQPLNHRLSIVVLPFTNFQLSPRDPLLNTCCCHAHTHLGQYDEAIDWCSRSIAVKPFWIAYADLATANALTGHEREAHAAVAELRRLRPNYTVALWLQDGSGWSDNVVFLAEFQRIAEGLRKAGLPE